MPKQIDPEERLTKLLAALEGGRTVLIVMQNNPDPDAIAAAAGLRQIANDLTGAACSLAHGGTIGRVENEALVRYLGLNTRPLTTLDLDRFDRIAMVDAQPGAGNVSLDAEVRLDVVIDHHPIRRETRRARFTDIRQRYGATSTILFEYLRAGNVEIDAPLATALVYGIRSDTQDLGRETTRADIEAFLSLYPSANPRALGRIVAAPLPRAYFARLKTVLDNAAVHGNRLISSLEGLDTPEMIGESADLLLRVDGVTWTLCYGVIDGWLNLSLRTLDREQNAGTVARRLAGRRGFGGGHQALAAAQIPLKPDQLTEKGYRRFTRQLIKRFLSATGPADDPGKALCQ